MWSGVLTHGGGEREGDHFLYKGINRRAGGIS